MGFEKTTLTENSKEIMSRLIRNEFDKIDSSMEFVHGESEKLINTAKELGLDDLAIEMANDLQIA